MWCQASIPVEKTQEECTTQLKEKTRRQAHKEEALAQKQDEPESGDDGESEEVPQTQIADVPDVKPSLEQKTPVAKKEKAKKEPKTPKIAKVKQPKEKYESKEKKLRRFFEEKQRVKDAIRKVTDKKIVRRFT